MTNFKSADNYMKPEYGFQCSHYAFIIFWILTKFNNAIKARGKINGLCRKILSVQRANNNT